MQMADFRDRIVEISTEASAEASLEAQLKKVGDRWTLVELTVRPYKDAKEMCVLGGVEDVMQVLEDSSVLLATIGASRFVTGRLRAPFVSTLENEGNGLCSLASITLLYHLAACALAGK